MTTTAKGPRPLTAREEDGVKIGCLEVLDGGGRLEGAHGRLESVVEVGGGDFGI